HLRLPRYIEECDLVEDGGWRADPVIAPLCRLALHGGHAVASHAVAATQRLQPLPQLGRAEQHTRADDPCDLPAVPDLVDTVRRAQAVHALEVHVEPESADRDALLELGDRAVEVERSTAGIQHEVRAVLQ